MSDPQPDGSESDGREEVSGEFVVTGGDGTEVFELVEESLDEVALAVEREIDRTADLDVALGRDMGGGAVGLDQFDDGPGVVAPVGDDVAGEAKAVDEHRQQGLVGGLAGAEDEADRQAPSVDDDVDLGAQSSTRTANGVIRAPFFPPAAC